MKFQLVDSLTEKTAPFDDLIHFSRQFAHFGYAFTRNVKGLNVSQSIIILRFLFHGSPDYLEFSIKV